MAEVIIFALERSLNDKGTWARSWTGCGEYPELTRIGAVCIDYDSRCVEGTFHTFVQPVFTWPPSEYHLGTTQTRLNDYTTDDRKRVPQPPEAIERFSRFATGKPIFCFGQEYISILQRNLDLHGVEYTSISPSAGERHFDITPVPGLIGAARVLMPVIPLDIIDILPAFDKAEIEIGCISAGELAHAVDRMSTSLPDQAWNATPLIEAVARLMESEHGPNIVRNRHPVANVVALPRRAHL